MRKKTIVWLMIAASLMLVGCILTDTELILKRR